MNYKNDTLQVTYLKLIEAIKSIESKRDNEIYNIKEKYNPEIKKYQDTITIIENLFNQKACLHCNGEGVISHMDGAGDIEHDDCMSCKGTGFINLK